MKRLGRIHSPDPRDGKHMLPWRPLKAAAPVSRTWTASSPVLDQGETSQCVIYATDKFLTAAPVLNEGFGTDEARTRVYREVQKLDEFPGEGYDGTSVRGAMKYLQAKGLVSSYKWAFDYETAIAHILSKGPLIMGTNWTEEMFSPVQGYISPKGRVVGGHAYVAIGADRARKNPDGTTGAVRCINSWGTGWGQQGRFWLTFRDFDALIKAQGEAATPIEVAVK